MKRAILFLMAAVVAAQAEVKLPGAISSHMVLQRDMAVPIWGLASPGEKVLVKFRNQQKETTADAKGNWRVKLDPLKAGGPDTLTVNALKVEDVLVGEVRCRPLRLGEQVDVGEPLQQGRSPRNSIPHGLMVKR